MPAITLSPCPFPTGALSPVIIDSFTALAPASTTPSAATRPPGRTSTRSPSRSSPTGTSSVSVPVRSPAMRVATAGSSLASSQSAPWACEIDRISSQWPRSMIVTRVASSSQRGIPG